MGKLHWDTDVDDATGNAVAHRLFEEDGRPTGFVVSVRKYPARRGGSRFQVQRDGPTGPIPVGQSILLLEHAKEKAEKAYRAEQRQRPATRRQALPDAPVLGALPQDMIQHAIQLLQSVQRHAEHMRRTDNAEAGDILATRKLPRALALLREIGHGYQDHQE